jgi:hypothetical protein
VINHNVRVTVLRVSGNRVRLGIEAPENIHVVRDELLGGSDQGPASGGQPAPRSPDLGRQGVAPNLGHSRREPRGNEESRFPRSPRGNASRLSRMIERRHRLRGPLRGNA